MVENTAFFGDVALRFPRIVHHYFDRNSDWGGLLRWGLNFCNLTGVFTGGAHQHVLTLVSPENHLSYPTSQQDHVMMFHLTLPARNVLEKGKSRFERRAESVCVYV